MKQGFDAAAIDYDSDFTNSNIGRAQRRQVWKLLDETMQNKAVLDILEVNCGTGEDAVWMAKKGHNVVASDVSQQMLEIANAKKKQLNIEFIRVDINNIGSTDFNKKFDLVFSNFGGLNCIDSLHLREFTHFVSKSLVSGGKFIAVIMPDFCIWETLYFLVKGKGKEAFRRRRKYAMANVSGTQVKTWYYSPQHFQSLVQTDFDVVRILPIGLFVPPSYLESFFSRKPGLLKFLDFADSKLRHFPWQAFLSDHYYIQLKAR